MFTLQQSLYKAAITMLFLSMLSSSFSALVGGVSSVTTDAMYCGELQEEWKLIFRIATLGARRLLGNDAPQASAPAVRRAMQPPTMKKLNGGVD